VPDLLYPDRRLEKLCQREGIPVLLLAPAFQEYAVAHQVYLHGFNAGLGSGHWNQNGHRLGGNLMARWLCGQLQGFAGSIFLRDFPCGWSQNLINTGLHEISLPLRKRAGEGEKN
jgi:hypothetical protein